jgi:hypothetical protein
MGGAALGWRGETRGRSGAMISGGTFGGLLLNEILPRGKSRRVGHSAVMRLAVWSIVGNGSLRIHLGHRLRGDGEEEDRGGADQGRLGHGPSSPQVVRRPLYYRLALLLRIEIDCTLPGFS